MNRRILERTGLAVTQLGYGSIGWRGPRTWGVRVVNDQDAEKFLNAVLDAGINFIDTSSGFCHATIAAAIPAKTLNDKLSASGTFALSASSGSSGAFFGWFDSDMPGDGRQGNLGIHFAGQGEGARLTLRLVTLKNQSCGTKVTEWTVIKKGEKIRPPSIKNDGTRYSWKLDYHPPDTGIYLGWFNGTEKEFSPNQAGNFVGVKIGGPTKVGHFFLPAYATAKTTPIERIGVRQHAATVSIDKGTGPVFVPQKVFPWKIVYDPTGNRGKGTIEAKLGDESTTLNLNNGDKEKGAVLNRFGLFTTHRGGSFVRIYFDDITYTAGSEDR